MCIVGIVLYSQSLAFAHTKFPSVLIVLIYGIHNVYIYDVCVYICTIYHAHTQYHIPLFGNTHALFFFYQADLLKLILGVRALLHQGISQTFSDT